MPKLLPKTDLDRNFVIELGGFVQRSDSALPYAARARIGIIGEL
jgi:hypothetical protein